MPETHETDAEEMKEEQTSEAQQKAREAKEEHERAEEDMKKLEESDEPPKDLEEWPDDAAKYVTYGGREGDHGYDEGPEQKLGPSSLQRNEDGSGTIDGEKGDDPDKYKGKPLKGGPTDPDTPELPGERKKREKLDRMHGEGSGQEGEGSGQQQEERSA